MNEELSIHRMLGYLALIGVVVGLGKLLASKEQFSWRLALGRSIVSAGLAVAAGGLVAFIPGLNQLGIIGLAAALAVLGEQALEKLLHLNTGTT